MGNFDKIYEFENIFVNQNYVLPVGKVRQVSELSIIPNGEIIEHIQSCDELTYVISGKAKILSDDNIHCVSGGEIHFIKKGVKHKIVADNDEKFRYVCIGIDIDSECNEIQTFTKKDLPNYFFGKDNGNIRYLTEMLLNEFYLKDEDSDIMINSLLIQIFISLSRIYDGDVGTVKKKEFSCNSSKLTLYEILRFIDREYINLKGIKQISEHIKYNEDYISHLFKKKMGITLKEYLLRKKISAAMELLDTSNLKIEEIADYLNFNSAHTFYQAFKRIAKVSPTEYKTINSGF